MVSKAYFSLLLTLPLLAVAGCSSLNEPAGITYAKSVTQLGINPVYPPREDIQVGDIYAVEAHSYADRLKAKTALIGLDDLTNVVRGYLNSRYKFADTVTKPNSEELARGQVDARGPTGVLPTDSDLRTLPMDGFPDIEVDSGITLGVGGQPQSIAVAFGFAAAKTLKMSLKYRGVTSYEIPTPVGLNALRDYCEKINYHICQSEWAARWINQKFQLGPGDPGYVKKAGSVIVTKVYLARQITYTFNDAVLAAAVARSVGKDGVVAGPAPAVTSQDISNILATGDAATINAATALLREVNDSVTSGGAGQGSLSLALANKNTVSINETFDRPVVVGYEGASWDGSWPDPK